MNKRTKKANRQGRRTRRRNKTWKGGISSSNLVGSLSAEETALIHNIINEFGVLPANPQATSQQPTPPPANKYEITNDAEITQYANKMLSDISSNELIHSSLGLYRELILVGEQFDELEKVSDIAKINDIIKNNQDKVKDAETELETARNIKLSILPQYNKIEKEVNDMTDLKIKNKKKYRDALFSFETNINNITTPSINDIKTEFDKIKKDSTRFSNNTKLLDNLIIEVEFFNTNNTNNQINIQILKDALDAYNKTLDDLSTKTTEKNNMLKDLNALISDETKKESDLAATKQTLTDSETDKINQIQNLDKINAGRNLLKKNVLDLIKLIRRLNYLYSPTWVDTLQYKVNIELLRNILNGNIIGFINKLTRPKPQSKSKGMNIKFDTYNSALNVDPTKPIKKKIVMSVDSYGNNPIETAEETLLELYNNPPTSLMQPIQQQAPISTTSQSFNISRHNP